MFLSLAFMFHEAMFDIEVMSYSDNIKISSGDTAVTFRQLGFSGQYFIYDLPPVLFLQQYFLR